jgi:hypothetical protein
MRAVVAGAALSLFFILVPMPALAATNSLLNPIVPAECHCDNQPDPTDPSKKITTAASYGCVLQTVQNGVNVLISLSILVFVLWLAYAGALFMASSASPGLREQGKTRIMNAVIGIIVILAAWLIVDFIMKTLYDNNSGFGPWNSILKSNGNDTCIVAKNPVSITTGSLSIVTGAPGTMTSSVAGGGTGATGLRIEAATSNITHNAGSGDGHACLHNVRQALSAGGVSLSCPHNGNPLLQYAGDCNAPLQALGFGSLGSGDSNPQKGDIVVIQHTAGNRIGHIAMFNGTNWVSDFVQSNGESPPGNPYKSGFGGAQYWRP